MLLRYILFHHQTTTATHHHGEHGGLRYILFHHQTTTIVKMFLAPFCCVISSFITKPQLVGRHTEVAQRCVISSFITKPQPVAVWVRLVKSCVISSFITKPQLLNHFVYVCHSCVISSFITKPQLRVYRPHYEDCCVISSFITKPQPVFLMCCNMIQLHDEYCTGNGMVNSLSMAKLLKKLKLNRLLLYFLFYLSPYIDDVGVLLVGYRDYTKSSLAGHEEFYSLDVYIP